MKLAKREIFKRLLALALLLVPITLAYTISQYPLRAKAESKIAALMGDAGFSDVQVEIASLSEKSAVFSRIAFVQQGIAVSLGDIRIDASSLPYRELLQKRYDNIAGRWSIGSLVVTGMAYDLPPLSGSGEFTSQSFSGALASASGSHAATFAITPESAKLSDIRFAWEKADISAQSLDVQVKELKNADYANASGIWTLKGLNVAGLEYEIPPLSGSGSLTTRSLDGALSDGAGTTRAHFALTPERARIEQLALLWKGARVSTSKVDIALGVKKPVHIPLAIQNLDMNTLLSMISPDKAKGTGTVSGNVELVLLPDGGFSLGKGMFGTHQEGVIQLAPDALPGDSPQVDMTRRALSNFHYKDLSITLSPDKDGKVSIVLKLEGNNPQEFDGRPVKLNVNLTGDVLELLQQTILPIGDPRKLIKEQSL